MRIAICDESREQRQELIGMIRASLAHTAVSYQVCEYTHAKDLLYDVQDGYGTDLAFVDLSSPDSWSCLVALRKAHFEGSLILMSDCGERVVDGYTIGAVGYLPKPFSLGRVREICLRLCVQTHHTCLTLNSRSSVVRVPYHEILYMESRNAKCVVHRVGGEEYTVYAHLDDLENSARDPRFLRCHQSYLVNMDHIVEADKQFVMTNGDTVSIRQRELHRLREAFAEYVRSFKK